MFQLGRYEDAVAFSGGDLFVTQRLTSPVYC